MSVELIDTNKITITRFNGGERKGICAQITISGSCNIYGRMYNFFTIKEVIKIRDSLNKYIKYVEEN